MSNTYTNIVENLEEHLNVLQNVICTYVLPKTKETTNPRNYRPVTCPPTMYQILTSIIAKRIYSIHF